MIPKRSRRRVTPVLRFVEGGQLSLEQHHYSPGVDNPEAPLSAKKRPVASDNPSDNAPRPRRMQSDPTRQDHCPDVP
jgi:hypothetical protein